MIDTVLIAKIYCVYIEATHEYLPTTSESFSYGVPNGYYQKSRAGLRQVCDHDDRAMYCLRYQFFSNRRKNPIGKRQLGRRYFTFAQPSVPLAIACDVCFKCTSRRLYTIGTLSHCHDIYEISGWGDNNLVQ